MYKNLSYRDNVCCIVFQADKFLIVQRQGWPGNWWKFPQGGIDPGETLKQAALRELKEEIGSENFRIIGESKYVNVYDWNDESIRLAGHQWRGQNQKYLIIEYRGDVNDIHLNPSEIKQYKWVTLAKLWENISQDDKNFTDYKTTIQKVLAEFSSKLHK